MTVACLLEWVQVTERQFRDLLDELNWHAKVEAGEVVYAPEEGGRMIALQAWETEEAFASFHGTCLRQVLRKIGLPEPAVTSWSLVGKQPRPVPRPLISAEDAIKGLLQYQTYPLDFNLN